MIFGIDISNHQGAFDVGQAKREGYEFLFAKSSEGTGFLDAYFFDNVRMARNCGMIPGAYHWLKRGNGALQAQILFDRLVTAGGPSGFLVACDNEDNADWQTTYDFFVKWNQLAPGHPIFMYTGKWWWPGWSGPSFTPLLWHSAYVQGTGYGAALYGSVNDSYWSGYGGWSSPTILQFSSTAIVAGKVIDVNCFRGSVADLKRFTVSGGSPSAIGGEMLTYGEALAIAGMVAGGTVTYAGYANAPENKDSQVLDLQAAVDATAANVNLYNNSVLLGKLNELLAAVGGSQPSQPVPLTEEQFEILRSDMRAMFESMRLQALHALAEAGEKLAEVDDVA